MPKNFILILSLILILQAFGQESTLQYGKRITHDLCSPKFHGRGYVNNGCDLAADYLSREFAQLKMDTFNGYSQQPFYLSVNTFPGRCKVRLGGKRILPGKDYLVHPSSHGYKGKITLLSMSAAEILKYSYNKNQEKNLGIAFKPSPALSKDTLKMVRTKLEKMARVQMPVVEYTREKLTWSVSNETYQFPYLQIFDTTISKLEKSIFLNIQQEFLSNISVKNVLGFIPSVNPSDSFIIVCAHYDHLGRMGKKTYFPGANDNASGVAMMLSLARSLVESPLQHHNVLFIAFAGEEIGLVGSQFFVNQNILGVEQVSLVLNLDIMGSGEEGITVVNGSVFPYFFDKLTQLNQSLNSVPVVKVRGKAANSDHYPFSEKGIPSLFIYTMGSNKNYHDIYDGSEALSFDKFEALHYLMLRFLKGF